MKNKTLQEKIEEMLSGRDFDDLKRLPEARMTVAEAMERQLPASGNAEEIDKLIYEALTEKPGFFAVQDNRSYGDLHTLVDVREYFDVFEELIGDDRKIMDYVDRLHPAFLRCPTPGSPYPEGTERLQKKEDRLDLIRGLFFGYDQVRHVITYDCSDQEMIDWFRREVVEERGFSGVKGHTVKDDFEMSRLENDLAYMMVDGIGNGHFGMKLDGGGRDENKKAIPVGDDKDLQKLEEFRWIVEKFMSNPHVVKYQITPGCGTSMKPTYFRGEKK